MTTTTHNVFIKKTSQTIGIDFNALPPASQEYIINYGLKQSLNDCIAPKEFEGEFAIKKVNERLAAILSGTMGIRGEREESNPFESECVRIAVAYLKAKGFPKPKGGEALTIWEDKVKEFSQHEKIKAKATESLALKASMKELAID